MRTRAALLDYVGHCGTLLGLFWASELWGALASGGLLWTSLALYRTFVAPRGPLMDILWSSVECLWTVLGVDCDSSVVSLSVVLC